MATTLEQQLDAPGGGVPTEPLAVADVLERAADLIEPEGRWTRGAYASDQHNDSVDTLHPDAKCFCAMGAVYRAAGASSHHKTGPLDLVRAVRTHLIYATGTTMVSFNDAPERTQAEVVAKLREAAALARSQVQP